MVYGRTTTKGKMFKAFSFYAIAIIFLMSRLIPIQIIILTRPGGRQC